MVQVDKGDRNKYAGKGGRHLRSRGYGICIHAMKITLDWIQGNKAVCKIYTKRTELKLSIKITRLCFHHELHNPMTQEKKIHKAVKRISYCEQQRSRFRLFIDMVIS